MAAHVKPEHLLHQRLGASVFLQAMHAEGWKVIQLERDDSWAQGASYLRARSLGSYNTLNAAEAIGPHWATARAWYESTFRI